MNSLRLLSNWQWPGVVFAITVASLAFSYYRRETRSLATYHAWLLPTLRSVAIFLLLLTFLEPVIHHRFREGNPGRVTFLIDGSLSMTMADDPRVAGGRGMNSTPATKALSRFDRASNLLLGNEQISMEKLAEEFEVSIQRLDASQSTMLWEASAEQVPPLPSSSAAWLPNDWSEFTALGDAIMQSKSNGQSTSKDGASAASAVQSVVVLLSDGQNNSGALPLEVAAQGAAGQTIFAVGYGATAEATDLAVLSAECPSRVFRSDTLRGTLRLKDQIGKGKSFMASFALDGEIIWKQKLTSENTTNRRVEFSLPVAPLYDLLQKNLPTKVKYAVLPMRLTAQVASDESESNLQNNSLPIYVSVAAQRSRLLLLDGRSRWENRYLRNMFERDPAWQIDSQIGTDQVDFHFPKTRDELFQYDVVLMGDLPASLLTREQISWLRDFVELSGGGLILISGSRRHLAQPAYAELQKLFPVTWKSTEPDEGGALQRILKRVELTGNGQSLSALRIDARGESESQTLWNQLPKLNFVDKVEVLPGAEVLATAISDVESMPLFVTRRYGAGRVFFATTDETWRWRYKVADLVHQRLWNQLTRWLMRTPMAVQGEYLSLDCGAASYAAGKNIEVRAQLRDRDGRPAPGKSPIALFSTGGKLIASVPLIEDPNVPATYFADVAALPAGDYEVSVEAAGFSREALDVHTNLTVVSPPSIEMQRITCDDQMLRELAQKTGGKYLAETDADQLFPLLRPLSSGRFVQSDTMLWQSYWWFTAAMVLLVAEWWLRKRAGLV